MTDLLGGAGQSDWYIAPGDKRHLSNAYCMQNVEFVYVGELGDMRTHWWPGSGGLGGDAGDAQPIGSVWRHQPDLTRGSCTRFGVVGVTRDANGAPLGGVNVKLYHTSDDTLVGSVVSDPIGNYTVTTPYYPDPHYIVFYKAGTPDVFGTSPNTLIGG